jgi:hypothetical protein
MTTCTTHGPEGEKGHTAPLCLVEHAIGEMGPSYFMH